jgi:hypothetical protein
MSATEHTTYRRLPDANAWAFDEPRRDPQHAPYTSAPSMDLSSEDLSSEDLSSEDLSSDDAIPLFLSDPQGQPDPREFAAVAANRRTSILTRVAAGGLVVSAFAILVAVAVFNSNVTRVIDKTSAPMGGATEDQSAMQAASHQPAMRQIPPKDPAVVAEKDPAVVAEPVTVGSVNASSPREETPSREAIVNASQTAPLSQAPAAATANEAAAPSKTLDAETLAALMTRARSLLARGDIAAARLLLERAANAQNASAAFLLAQTYDPAVLGVRDARSTTPDPVMARNWYRAAAGFGSADARQRLTQLQD